MGKNYFIFVYLLFFVKLEKEKKKENFEGVGKYYKFGKNVVLWFNEKKDERFG